MEAEYDDPKYRRRKTNITNRHYYEVENFNTVLDMQIQGLSNHFNEVTTEVLIYMNALSSDDNFSAFDVSKILRLVEVYLYDFNCEERDDLMHELDIYINNIRGDKIFGDVKGISNLAKMIVETKKHVGYLLVYRLLKLALILSVATTCVERCFSSMKHVKTDLRNQVGDDYLNDACICYIEKEFSTKVTVEDVMNRFQNMKPPMEQL